MKKKLLVITLLVLLLLAFVFWGGEDKNGSVDLRTQEQTETSDKNPSDEYTGRTIYEIDTLHIYTSDESWIKNYPILMSADQESILIIDPDDFKLKGNTVMVNTESLVSIGILSMRSNVNVYFLDSPSGFQIDTTQVTDNLPANVDKDFINSWALLASRPLGSGDSFLVNAYEIGDSGTLEITPDTEPYKVYTGTAVEILKSVPIVYDVFNVYYQDKDGISYYQNSGSYLLLAMGASYSIPVLLVAPDTVKVSGNLNENYDISIKGSPGSVVYIVTLSK